MTSHENFLVQRRDRDPRHRHRPRDGPALRNLVSVPLFHVTGCNSQLLAAGRAARHDGRAARLRRPDVPAHGRRRAHRPAHHRARDLRARARPAATSPTSTSRRSAGSPTAARRSRPTLVRRIQEAFPNARVGNGFGLTETSSIATFLPHEWAAEHADSVGFAAPVVDLALDEPDRRRRRAAGPRAQRRRRLLEQAGGHGGRTFVDGGCTPGISPGSTTGSSGSSTGPRT